MIVVCPRCGAIYEIEENDPDVIIEPAPHIECKQCGGTWIFLF